MHGLKRVAANEAFAKITRDITERQQAHEELLSSERRYRQLIEAVVDYAIFQLEAPQHSKDCTGPSLSRSPHFE